MKVNLPYILLITDSLAFPRLEPELVCYEDTYIAQLKREFPNYDFIHLGRGGGTITELYNHTSYFHHTISPALVIMQCGIVDCAPRTTTVIEQQIISRLPIIGSLLGRLIKRYAKNLRQFRKITYTSLTTYVEYIEKFESMYRNIHWVGILPASANYESNVNGITENIQRFNHELRKHKYISTDDFTENEIMSDFHHLNINGHQKLFNRLRDLIKISDIDDFNVNT
ncbi:SGNH/GDSL hydrolase family protein [Parvibium lacunae]|uniref:SGNH/GDSL hydrolase family protein n=1 Tax=Parvibium lacunae TaxID=1888893 RepID=A0A368L1I3_9BURK|nr:SGNH/GDSL hydrolase family protein [Parvibium lacunae]RCS57426.1 SGNH/GDSL hydrolase family protein [Parvibium lacunae]